MPQLFSSAMIQRTILVLFTFGLFCQDLSSQSETGYIPPMDIPLILSGNFGEMRRNHFHTGIDIKTQGKQGIPLLSITDGYVSRIKVSPYGYGNALYIDHPDGRTSVYAHMRSFNDSIAAYIREKQYNQERWAIEYYPAEGELQLAQGDVIGLSGNSGSSSGPHLHFEIRDTKSEHPLNPQALGIEISDTKYPVVKGVRVYPLDGTSHIAGAAEPTSYVAVGTKYNTYRTEKNIMANGTIGLAIHTFDLMPITANKYGIYHLKMYVNDILHYSHTMDELDFDNFRQVNCHKDYDLYHLNRWRYHKCFRAENNTLEIYETLVNEGNISISEGDTLSIRFETSDIKGNISILYTTIIGSTALTEPWPTPSGILLEASKDNIYLDSGLVARLPKGRIYNDLYLNPLRKLRPKGISDEYRLHDHDTPLDGNIFISIRPHTPIGANTHVIMEHRDAKGRTKHLVCREHDGWYEAENKSLGTYRLIEDNVPPHFSVKGLDGKGKGKKDAIVLSLGDNVSGVVGFKLHVDGRWLLMSHNASMSKAWGKLSELGLEPGEHTLQVEVWDLAGNLKSESILFHI